MSIDLKANQVCYVIPIRRAYEKVILKVLAEPLRIVIVNLNH